MDKCKITKQEDEKRNDITNTKDPKYWDRKKWKGPKFLKAGKLQKHHLNYLNSVVGKASTIIIPNYPVYYSRDNVPELRVSLQDVWLPF